MNFLYLILACVFSIISSAANAEDIRGGQDHPLFGRYDGAEIVYYNAVEYEEYALLQAPHDYAALLENDNLSDRSGADWLKANGRLTRIRYEIPVGVSSLQVLRNYETALKSKGFEIAFACEDSACLTGNLRDPYLLGQQIDTDNGLSTLYFDHARYMLTSLDGPQGKIYGSVLVGEDKGAVTVFLAVLEMGMMPGGKIGVMDAATLQHAIDAAGTVSIYGIRFDFDKDTLRPESKSTLDEIATLMARNPQLRLEIIGHTDDRGSHEYNMKLSQSRAANVVVALIQDYDIAPERLTSSGAGSTMPVTSNATEEDRARNRRVELVAR